MVGLMVCLRAPEEMSAQRSSTFQAEMAADLLSELEGTWTFQVFRRDSTVAGSGHRTFRTLTPTGLTLVWTEEFDSGLQLGGLLGYDPERHRFWEVGVAPDAPTDMWSGQVSADGRTIVELTCQITSPNDPNILAGGRSHHLRVHRGDVPSDESNVGSIHQSQCSSAKHPGRLVIWPQHRMVRFRFLLMREDPLVRRRSHGHGAHVLDKGGIVVRPGIAELEQPVQ